MNDKEKKPLLTEENAGWPATQWGRRLHRYETNTIGEPPPGVLYHYTDVAGLKGILAEGAMWATHHRYVNDTLELEYGKLLIAKISTEFLVGKSSGVTVTVEKAIEAFHDPSFRSQYLLCFTEERESLAQWRSYSNNGKGFAIGIDTSAQLLAHEFAGVWPQRVKYDANEQEVELRHWFTSIADEVDTYEYVPGVCDSGVDCYARIGGYGLELMGNTFKHPSFSYEKEWRLMIPNEAVKAGVKIRTSALGLVPYVPVKLHHEGASPGKLPIVEIRIGPALDGDLNREALEFLLKECGYSDIAIDQSSAPLRP